MKKIALVFSSAPYGNNKGKDGLNIALSMSCYTNKISIFFIQDGIFQIFNKQNPKLIFLKKYSNKFNVLPVCNIKNFYLCSTCLSNRGFTENINFVVQVKYLNITEIISIINRHDCILNF
ncbi:Protein TusC [Buchnera aphidicola (Pterocallis alni)]|uniref:sulfurtransferase complex subunit TusC n=1 Tax=Buchnera aphidicola TaxID=9 RepID=UPI003464A439